MSGTVLRQPRITGDETSRHTESKMMIVRADSIRTILTAGCWMHRDKTSRESR
jgi:hypothetical protein